MIALYIFLALLIGVILGGALGAWLMKVNIIQEVNKQVEANRPIVQEMASTLNEMESIIHESKQ